MIDCRMTLERLYPYLDRELSEAEIEEVRAHLDLCPPCAKHFEFESGMIRVVGDACRKTEAPPELKSRILAARLSES